MIKYYRKDGDILIAYHIDRAGSLQIGQTIQPFIQDNIYRVPHLSNWGLSVVEDPLTAIETINTHNIEVQAENIRKDKFPDMPSRFSSFFGIQELEHLSLWRNILHFTNDAKVYEISYEGFAPLLDAKFLNVKACNDIFNDKPCLQSEIERTIKLIESIYLYWSGACSKNPLPELLIPLPVTVVREISLDTLP